MPYLHISDFKYGMDRRRSQFSGIPGTLWILRNAFISRGGDIVRAKKFDPAYSLPAGTFGLAGLKGQPYVFGSATSPVGLPFGVQYQQLAAPSTPTMVRVLDAKPVDGKLYVVAEYDNGNVYHFYDGSRVTDWDALADANSSFASVAELLATKIDASASVRAEAFGAEVRLTARVAGTAFTCTASATDVDSDASAPTATQSTVTVNVPAVAEVVATGTVEIAGGSSAPGVDTVSQVTVNGVSLLAAPVDWVSSNSATATALAVAINNNAAVSGYTAAVLSGAIVTIYAAAGAGATPNGYVVAASVTGSVSVTTANMSGGVTAVEAVAQVDKVVIGGGSYDATDRWSIVVDGTTYLATGRASGTGRSIFVHKRRVYSPANSLLRYCVLNDFTDWSTTATPPTDAGFINMSVESDGAQDLTGAAKYNGFAAIFAVDNVLIWTIDTDAENNESKQTLENTGTRAPRSIASYGDTDVFYLEEATGIRSIRSRDGYNAGYVSDVGGAIDSFVKTVLDANDADTISRASAIIDPDGRYLLAVGDTIFALSYFPSSKITAWSYIQPGFDIEDFARIGRRIYARSGDTVYLYGGTDGDVYPDADEQVVLVETPFMSANDPAGLKNISGFDIACTNEWETLLLPDPNDPSKTIDIGVLNRITYNGRRIAAPGYTSHFALRMTCAAAGDAVIESVALHYNKDDAS